jgi:zinc protease
MAVSLLGFALVFAAFLSTSNAQTLPEPTREQLLNRLSVLFYQQPGQPNVFLKLRVHSGATFDLAGKGGTMMLLSDVFFPDPTTREYVAEELGGKLEVTTDYDAIDITISGKAAEFERMVEFLRTALVTTQLTPENVAKARDARIKQMSSVPESASQLADRAIAVRLFGRYPYGHAANGSIDSLTKVDRADLLLARERFLNPDNATLVVIGGIDKSRAMRALRQLLGQWRKGDQLVPATFQPPPPADSRVLLVHQPSATNAEIRLAVRGIARADHDYPSALLLSLVARERWRAAVPSSASGFIRLEAHSLPGSFIIGASAPPTAAAKVIAAARDLIHSLITSPASTAEIESARNEAIGQLTKEATQTESIADLWLDIETYRLPPYDEEIKTLKSLNAPDVQRVANRLFKDANVAVVVVGNSDQLKASLGTLVESFETPKSVPVSVTPASKP